MKIDKYKEELNSAIIKSMEGGYIVRGKVVERVLNDFYEAKLKENMAEETICPCGKVNNTKDKNN